MITHEKLLPCPFCGGEAGLRNTLAERKASSPTSAYVMCKSCLASTSSFEGSTCVSKAISAWNRRTPPAAVPEPWGWLCNGKGDGWEERDKVVRDPKLIARYRERPDLWRIEPLYLGSPPAAVPDAWSKLLLAAKILYHNAEVCVANHHGRDFKAFGLPGWLADCKRDIENAEASLAGISAAPTPPVDDGWRPIETAPRDGTVIDVWLGCAEPEDVEFYCGPGNTRRAASWHWHKGKFRPAMGLEDAVPPVFVQPTHWRPLPPPPGESE